MNKKEYISLIKKHKKAKNWDAMLMESKKALQEIPQGEERFFLKSMHFAQVHYVDEKLKSPLLNDLEEKEAFEELLQVYARLLMVFPDSKKLKKKMEKLKMQMAEQKNQIENEVLTETDLKLKTLVKEERFDEALEACYQVLSYMPNHKVCIKMTQKMLKKRNKQIDKEIGAFFEKSYALVKDEHKANKDSVIKF